MGFFDFIFGVLVLAVLFILGIGAIAMHYDTKHLQEENEELKKDLEKARKKIIKEEYKKVSRVRTTKKEGK